jgi:hypothetical protein
MATAEVIRHLLLDLYLPDELLRPDWPPAADSGIDTRSSTRDMPSARGPTAVGSGREIELVTRRHGRPRAEWTGVVGYDVLLDLCERHRSERMREFYADFCGHPSTRDTRRLLGSRRVAFEAGPSQSGWWSRLMPSPSYLQAQDAPFGGRRRGDNTASSSDARRRPRQWRGSTHWRLRPDQANRITGSQTPTISQPSNLPTNRGILIGGGAGMPAFTGFSSGPHPWVVFARCTLHPRVIMARPATMSSDTPAGARCAAAASRNGNANPSLSFLASVI